MIVNPIRWKTAIVLVVAACLFCVGFKVGQREGLDAERAELDTAWAQIRNDADYLNTVEYKQQVERAELERMRAKILSAVRCGN